MGAFWRECDMYGAREILRRQVTSASYARYANHQKYARSIFGDVGGGFIRYEIIKLAERVFLEIASTATRPIVADCITLFGDDGAPRHFLRRYSTVFRRNNCG